jgi:hypothetical protein
VIDQPKHVRALLADMVAFHAWARQAARDLVKVADDAEALAGAQSAHAAIVSALAYTAMELGMTYEQTS